MIVLWSIWFGVSICQVIKYARSGDNAGLFVGLCGIFLSLVGIVLFVKIGHAVVRRMRATPTETI